MDVNVDIERGQRVGGATKARRRQPMGVGGDTRRRDLASPKTAAGAVYASEFCDVCERRLTRGEPCPRCFRWQGDPVKVPDG